MAKLRSPGGIWQAELKRKAALELVLHLEDSFLPQYTRPIVRLTVRQGMRFRGKRADILPQIATITEDDIQ
jgi:hypothetical protein